MSRLSVISDFFSTLGASGRDHDEPAAASSPAVSAPSERSATISAAKAPSSAPAAAPPPRAAGAAISEAGPAEVGRALLVDQALRADCHRTADILRLGRMAHEYVADKPDRAAAIAEIRGWYGEVGLRGDILHVNRQIQSYWLSRLFERDQIRSFGLAVVYALLPLVKRDAKTNVWVIRPGIEAQAAELVALAATEQWTSLDVSERVAALFPPRKKREAKKSPRRLAKLQQQIRRLPPDDFAELRNWLQSIDRAAAA